LLSQLTGFLVAGALAAGVQGAQQSSPGGGAADSVQVRAVRFFRGDRTLVNGFVRVPHAMLDGIRLGPGGLAVFSVDVSIVDTAGTVLTQDRWTRQVPWAAAQVAGAATVDPLTFSVAPGSYHIRVAVRDSASGRRKTADLAVGAYAARPAASDVLLAYRVRRASSGDTTAAPGEVRKGDLFITAAPDPMLTPSQAALSFYCEVYRDSAGAVPWLVRVLDQQGKSIVATQPAQAALGAGGGPLTGALDLGGLPPGTYRLALVIGSGADTVARTAPFRMGGFEAEQRVEAVARAAEEPSDLFARMSEAQLDTLFEPLVYLTSGGELAVYRGLTVDGKRRFLRAFWRKRDTTPATSENEEMAAFYKRINEANVRFREGGAAQVPGWRTDRGRIFIKYGEPDQVMKRPQNGPDHPWEAWKFSRTRGLKFVFMDMTRLGNYSLLYTNDRTETSVPNWATKLSNDAIQEITTF